MVWQEFPHVTLTVAFGMELKETVMQFVFEELIFIRTYFSKVIIDFRKHENFENLKT